MIGVSVTFQYENSFDRARTLVKTLVRDATARD